MKLTLGEKVGLFECPYLKRWVLDFDIFALRLHRWQASDDVRAFHDHPWWFLILFYGIMVVEVIMNAAIKNIAIMGAGVVSYECIKAAVRGIKEYRRLHRMPKWMRESEKRSHVDYGAPQHREQLQHLSCR